MNEVRFPNPYPFLACELLSTSRSSDFAQMNDLDPRSKFDVLASDLVGV
jgi:hypothetical protein